MKALVTGATGLLGANIVNHLLKQGHEVRALVRKTSSTKAIDDLDCERVVGDIVDPASLGPAMEGVDWVFHAAASVAMWKGAWKESHRINVDGTRNMLEAALNAGVKRFVHTSSISALGLPEYGEVGDESLEWDLPFDFVYNRTKRLAEEEVQKAVRKGLEAVILNPGMIFGERDVNLNAGSIIVDIKGGKMPICPPGGNGVCDADEVAKAHIVAAERGKVGERYIVAGENVTFREIFETAADVARAKPPKIIPSAGLARAIGKISDRFAAFGSKEPLITYDKAFWSSSRNYYSSRKAERELEFKIVPIRQSIEKCYDWYLKQGILKVD